MYVRGKEIVCKSKQKTSSLCFGGSFSQVLHPEREYFIPVSQDVNKAVSSSDTALLTRVKTFYSGKKNFYG
jgi:hypothetical protein